jgi:hypothetical protein
MRCPVMRSISSMSKDEFLCISNEYVQILNK